jgi:Kef-type K+ transport system membrane component KefB
VKSPLLIAIILSATSLGVVIPVLKDAGESSSSFGQTAIAGATIADFGAIILLSLFFSGEATNTGTKLVFLAGFVLFAIALAFAILRVERSMQFSAVLLRLQDTTAQIRVRGAFMLLAGLIVLAELLGLEVILGAFIGVILRLIDRDRMMAHPQLGSKLEAISFGVFIPIFFVKSGLQFDLAALFASPSTLLRVPIFLVALLLVRGVPALVYRPLMSGRRMVVAGLLQATSAALISAGMLSVLLFPTLALTLMRSSELVSAPAQE